MKDVRFRRPLSPIPSIWTSFELSERASAITSAYSFWQVNPIIESQEEPCAHELVEWQV